jgi:hypothetical protein
LVFDWKTERRQLRTKPLEQHRPATWLFTLVAAGDDKTRAWSERDSNSRSQAHIGFLSDTVTQLCYVGPRVRIPLPPAGSPPLTGVFRL